MARHGTFFRLTYEYYEVRIIEDVIAVASRMPTSVGESVMAENKHHVRTFIRVIAVAAAFGCFFLANQAVAVSVVKPSHRYYEYTWGTWPNYESVSTAYLSTSSLIFDAVDYKILNKKLNDTWYVVLFNTFFQATVSMYSSIMVHEGGHALRFREFGSPSKIILHLPFGAETISTRRWPTVLRNADGLITVAGAGLEMATMITNSATKEMYAGGEVRNVHRFPILINKIVNMLYAETSRANAKKKLKGTSIESGDHVGYAMLMTAKYGYYDTMVPFFNGGVPGMSSSYDFFVRPYLYTNPWLLKNSFYKEQLRRIWRAYLIEVCDPVIVNVIYSFFAGGDGLSFTPLMPRIGPVAFMPATRAALGYVGAENYIDLHGAVREIFEFTVYYRFGGNKYDRLSGGGIELRNIRLHRRLFLGLQADYWTVRRINRNHYRVDYLAYTSVDLWLWNTPYAGSGSIFTPMRANTIHYWSQTSNRHRYNLYANVKWNVYDALYLVGGIGYKTYGGLMGKQLASGVYGRGGLGFVIDWDTIYGK